MANLVRGHGCEHVIEVGRQLREIDVAVRIDEQVILKQCLANIIEGNFYIWAG
jgi:hypothetical protein